MPPDSELLPRGVNLIWSSTGFTPIRRRGGALKALRQLIEVLKGMLVLRPPRQMHAHRISEISPSNLNVASPNDK